MKTILRTFVGCTAILFGTACMGAVKYVPENMKVELSLKVPGNNAVNYKLHPDKLENSYFDYEWRSDNKLPITVFHKVEERDSCMRLDCTAYRCTGCLLQLSSIVEYGLSP